MTLSSISFRDRTPPARDVNRRREKAETRGGAEDPVAAHTLPSHGRRRRPRPDCPRPPARPAGTAFRAARWRAARPAHLSESSGERRRHEDGQGGDGQPRGVEQHQGEQERQAGTRQPAFCMIGRRPAAGRRAPARRRIRRAAAAPTARSGSGAHSGVSSAATASDPVKMASAGARPPRGNRAGGTDGLYARGSTDVDRLKTTI